MMPPLAMSLGDRFFTSSKDGTGGGGWVHSKSINSMAMSQLCFGKGLYVTGWTVSLLLSKLGLENNPPPFLNIEGLDRCLLAKSADK